MFIDSTGLPGKHTIDADICIIGAGAAGITMARELRGSSLRVVVLESGGLEYNERTQSLYTGENIGLPTFDLQVNRLRFFGGTTNHWAGHCRPLEPIDFERRDWLPHSGWPLSRADLEPYYRRAQPICDLGPYKYEDLGFWIDQTGQPALELDASRLQSVVYNSSKPTRFGKVYRAEMEDASNISVYLNANVLELETDAAETRVTRARVACIDGPEFSVSARVFVLAAGGMENVRILLLSDKSGRAGLGNDHDLVGRYFMDHILLRPGANISFSQPGINLRLYRSLHRVAGGRMFSVITPTDELMRREEINNFRIHIFRFKPRYDVPMGGVFSILDEVTEAPQTEAESQAAQDEESSISLHLVLEPIPNPDSRITLSSARDLLGQRKLAVDWRLTPVDLENADRALELVGLELGRLGLGRAYSPMFRDPGEWPDNLEAGRHHCGTTRMSVSPSTGVVDQNCRVHGVTNLYVAGSSVFPTIGYANPTLTIVALALRLADHLKGSL